MNPSIESFQFNGNGLIPNSRLPVIVYRNVYRGTVLEMEDGLRVNDWHPTWHNNLGMVTVHHFHSEAHELIVINSGTLRGQLGGHLGETVELRARDAVLLPAGVGHLGLSFSEDLRVTGAFPAGQCFTDFRLGYASEYDELCTVSRLTRLPAKDPFFGALGPLAQLWTAPQARAA